jgi:hypothetical protein
MPETDKTPAGDDLTVVEVEATGEDEQGDVVDEDIVAVVDAEGHVLATDETLTVITAEGDIIVDETISAVGEDGELHVVEEDVVVIEHEETEKA